MIPTDNPFAGLQAYDLRHLARHLDERDRIDDLHRLLAMETASGSNAWYEAQDAVDDLATFVADLLRARARTVAAPLDALDTRCVQLRYTLSLATVNSLADRFAADLVAPFVEAGLWSDARGLATARRIPDDERRAIALGALAAKAPTLQADERWQETLETVAHIAHERRRGAALARLAASLPLRWHGHAEALLTGLESVDARVDASLEFALACPDPATAMRLLAAADDALPRLSSDGRRSQAKQLRFAVAARLHGIGPTWSALDEAELGALLTTAIPRFGDAAIADLARSFGASSLRDDAARSALSVRLVSCGDIDGAYALATPLVDVEQRRRAFVAIAAARAAHGDVVGALALESTLTRPAHKAALLAAIAAAVPRESAEPILARAIVLVPSIFNLRDRSAARAAIAEALSVLGQGEAALAMAKAIDLLPARIDVLAKLAVRQPDVVVAIAEFAATDVGRPALIEALPRLPADVRLALLQLLVRRTRNIADRATQVVCIAQMGALDPANSRTALALAEAIDDVAQRSRVLVELASVIDPRGFDPMLAMLDAIDNATLAERVFARLLPRLLSGQDGGHLQLVEAIEHVNRMADPECRADALVALAAVMPPSLLEALLVRAAADAQGIADPVARARLLTNIAVRMPADRAAEVWTRLIEEIERLVSAYGRHVDVEAASRVARIGRGMAPHLDRATSQRLGDAVKPLSAHHYRDEVLAELVVRLVALGDDAAAIAWAAEIGEARFRLQACIGLARRLPPAGRERELERLADDLPADGDGARVRALLALADETSNVEAGKTWWRSARIAIEAMRPSRTAVAVADDEYDEPERLLLQLARRWAPVDRAEAADALDEALARLANKSRSTALGLLPDAARVLAAASIEGFATLATDSVTAVGRWWP